MLYEKWNYVLAIAEEQNLTRAAKRLFISQPALTLYLNRLEKELGVKLFDRSRTPILLTEAGKYYVEQMKKSPPQSSPCAAKSASSPTQPKPWSSASARYAGITGSPCFSPPSAPSTRM